LEEQKEKLEFLDMEVELKEELAKIKLVQDISNNNSMEAQILFQLQILGLPKLEASKEGIKRLLADLVQVALEE
jgi:hypothetical protein